MSLGSFKHSTDEVAHPFITSKLEGFHEALSHTRNVRGEIIV